VKTFAFEHDLGRKFNPKFRRIVPRVGRRRLVLRPPAAPFSDEYGMWEGVFENIFLFAAADRLVAQEFPSLTEAEAEQEIQAARAQRRKNCSRLTLPRIPSLAVECASIVRNKTDCHLWPGPFHQSRIELAGVQPARAG
jgi:hypothetical protein